MGTCTNLHTSSSSYIVGNLHQAVLHGDVDTVRSRLADGEWVDQKDFHGATPLHYSAMTGNVAVAEALLNGGADLKYAGEQGVLAIHHAACLSSPKMAMFLVQRGADVNEVDINWRTPMHYAANTGQLEVVRFLLRSGARMDAKDKSCNTPLMVVMEQNTRKKMQKIVEEVAREFVATRAAPIRYPEMYRVRPDAPLQNNQWCVHCGRLPEDCLCHSITACNPDEFLHLQAQMQQVQVRVGDEAVQVSEPSQAGGWFSWGGSKPAKPNPHTMHSEARDGKILQIRDQIRSGQEVNVHDFVGATPLHYSAMHARYLVSAALLEAGAHTNARDNKGKTPLHYAVLYEQRDLQVVGMLLESRAEVDAADDCGRTPLHMAACAGSRKACEMLLCAGAKVDVLSSFLKRPMDEARDESLKTLLQPLVVRRATCPTLAHPRRLAAPVSGQSLWQSGRVQTSGKHLLHEAVVSSQTVGLKPVEDLLVAGENPNSRDYQERTPLHVAATAGLQAVVATLLRAGGEADARDVHGRTPLMAAAAHKHAPCMRLLLDRGASVDAVDHMGRNAVHHAAESGHKDAVILLIGSCSSANYGPKERFTMLNASPQSAPWLVKDNSGKTPEDVATCEEVLEVLKHHSRRDTGGGGFIDSCPKMPYSKTTEKWDKELAELSSDALRYPKRSAEGGMQLLHRVLLQVAQASCPEGKWLGGGMGTGIPALVQMLSEVMPASLQIHIRAVREQAVLVQTGHRPNEKADTHNPRHAVEVCQVVADLMDWAVVNPAQQGGYSNFERKSFMLSRDLDRAEPKHIIT